MYICCDCGHVFDEPKHYSEDRTPGGAFEGGSFIEHYTGCPYCGGAYDDAMECQRCEDAYISTDSEYPFCESCIKEIISSYKSLMHNTFREDEYEMILDHIDSIDPYHE